VMLRWESGVKRLSGVVDMGVRCCGAHEGAILCDKRWISAVAG
jgi:hypothetical protein